jgi:hypothetical protein
LPLARARGTVAVVIVQGNTIAAEELAARTGWVLKPEGACKGERCVPLGGATDAVDAAMLAQRLGMGLARDEAHGLLAIGPESEGPALASAELPDITLPDRDGAPFALRSLRGSKVFLLVWASW